MKKTSLILPLAATVAIWSLAGNAVAHWGGDSGGCGPGMGKEHMDQMYERRTTELHKRLKLNAEQEKAWKTFVAKEDALRPKDRLDRKELAKLDAPQRMEKVLDHMHEREKRMTGMLASLKDFYAVLTPQQQKTFDEFMPGSGAHHMRRSGGGSSGAGMPAETNRSSNS
jgi:protein CpxP